MRAFWLLGLAWIGCADRPFTPPANELPDASNRDAPAVDAPSRDAPAIDAPVPRDAAPHDAARSDAARRDGSTMDARPRDAALMDAPLRDAPSIDAPPPDAAVPPVFCTGDQISGVAAGYRFVPSPMQDFIPLCSGQLLMGDRVANRIVLENIITGTVVASYQLPSAPGDMNLDRQNGILYVAMPPATALARIDLVSGTVSLLPLPHGPLAVATGRNGLVYVIGNEGFGFTPWLLVVDGNAGTVLQTLRATAFLNKLAYDPIGGQLIASDGGALYRYAADSTTGMLALAQSRGFFTEGCNEIGISPLGGHVGYACVGSGGPPFVIPDLSPINLDMALGAWDVGSPAYGVSFAPDGTAVATLSLVSFPTYQFHVQTFSVAAYTALSSFTTTLICGTSTDQFTFVRYSRGGRILFAYLNCLSSSGTPTPTILWWVLP